MFISLRKIITRLFKLKIPELNRYILYRIIESYECDSRFLIQCVNTQVTFLISIEEMVKDKYVIYGLSPRQACFIGFSFSKKISSNKIYNNKSKHNQNNYLVCRYGNYRISYQDRDGKIGFIDNKTGREFVMDPGDIAFSIDLISEFDSAQAFYIGFHSGLIDHKSNNFNKNNVVQTHLRLVK